MQVFGFASRSQPLTIAIRIFSHNQMQQGVRGVLRRNSLESPGANGRTEAARVLECESFDARRGFVDYKLEVKKINRVLIKKD
jgi:hypothetical protein